MRVCVEAIKDLAIGRWPEIITALAPHFSLIVVRGKRHGPCPLCGGKDRARCHNDFSESGGIFCNVCKGGADGFAVLQWANSWTFSETLQAVTSYLDLGNGQIPIAKPFTWEIKQPPSKTWDNERRRLEAVWDGSKPDTGRIAEYFSYRGLSIAVPETLRLHPALSYYHQGPPVKYPCMIAQIIRDGKMVGLHRTWLDPDSQDKAPCSQPRKTWKCVEAMTGGAIRLYDIEPGKPLAVFEGIESALAVREITGWPVWSAINSTMLEKVQLPDSVRSIYIGGDYDKSGAGQRATERLGERLHLEGREVQIALPRGEIVDGQKSIDWLDVLNQERAHV
jgi:putative DNA primase/helicase